MIMARFGSECIDKMNEIVPLVCGEIKAIASRLTLLEVPTKEVQAKIAKRIKEKEDDMGKTLGSLDSFLESLDGDARESAKSALTKFMGSMEESSEIFDKYFGADEESPTEAPPAPPE